MINNSTKLDGFLEKKGILYCDKYGLFSGDGNDDKYPLETRTVGGWIIHLSHICSIDSDAAGQIIIEGIKDGRLLPHGRGF
jgi:hypothetical protein